jgi:hypothetical protein
LRSISRSAPISLSHLLALGKPVSSCVKICGVRPRASPPSHAISCFPRHFPVRLLRAIAQVPPKFDKFLVEKLGEHLIPQEEAVFHKTVAELLPRRVICVWKPRKLAAPEPGDPCGALGTSRTIGSTRTCRRPSSRATSSSWRSSRQSQTGGSSTGWRACWEVPVAC